MRLCEVQDKAEKSVSLNKQGSLTQNFKKHLFFQTVSASIHTRLGEKSAICSEHSYTLVTMVIPRPASGELAQRGKKHVHPGGPAWRTLVTRAHILEKENFVFPKPGY